MRNSSHDVRCLLERRTPGAFSAWRLPTSVGAPPPGLLLPPPSSRPTTPRSSTRFIRLLQTLVLAEGLLVPSQLALASQHRRVRPVEVQRADLLKNLRTDFLQCLLTAQLQQCRQLESPFFRLVFQQLRAALAVQLLQHFPSSARRQQPVVLQLLPSSTRVVAHVHLAHIQQIRLPLGRLAPLARVPRVHGVVLHSSPLQQPLGPVVAALHGRREALVRRLRRDAVPKVFVPVVLVRRIDDLRLLNHRRAAPAHLSLELPK